MGLIHASIINQIPEANLVAIADINPSLKSRGRSLGLKAPFFSSPDRLIENVQLDGVFICTPPHLNYELSAKFIEKGVSVFVEKPLADNIANAEKMLKLAQSKTVMTSCGYMVAYHPIFQRLKEMIAAQEYGRVIEFDSSCYISQALSKKTPKNTWRYDPLKTGGGVLMTMASHLAFLLHWYFGEVQSVKSKIKSIYTNMDDEVDAELLFGDGIKGQVKASWSIKGYEDLTISFRLDFEKALVSVTNRLITVETNGRRHKKEVHISALQDNALFELGGKGYYAQDRDFIASLINGRDPLTAWSHSMAAQKIIQTICEHGVRT